jgi:hypothetical protein
VDTATRQEISLVAEDDNEIVRNLLGNPSGSEKIKRRWLEFDCQNGVHHGKYATWENGQRKRFGHVGRFNKASGEYATRRVREFIQTHDCHYPERFTKDLDECGIRGIEVKDWASGRGVSGLQTSED